MKRSPLRRRSPLRAKKTITRRAPVLRGRQKKPTAHALRPRAPAAWFDWIHTQPCFVKYISMLWGWEHVTKGWGYDIIKSLMGRVTVCIGRIEADHMGSKMKDGDGEMAADRTCVSMCHGHHQERHAFTGTFRLLLQSDMRIFLALGIEWMQKRAGEQGIEIPDC